MKMTIHNGISNDGDQQVPEVTNDVMLAPPANLKLLKLARQKSFTNLPDFTYLLESLNTPTLKVDFDFASAPSEELAYSEGLTSQYSESLSLYPESQKTTTFPDLKKVKVEFKTEPHSDFEEENSPWGSPNGGCSSSEGMGIDNEVENSRLAVVGGDFLVKSDCREDERTDNSAEQTVHELSKKMDKCCTQLNIMRDPTQWTAHDVYRWACWILHESYTGCNWALGQLEKLQIDGTTLCMLHHQDFVNRIGGELGELLFIEIDLWKNAYCIEVQSVMDAQNQQQMAATELQYNRLGYPTTAITTAASTNNQLNYHHHNQGGSQPLEEQPTYVDISDNRPLACTISSIPTPQFEMSAITLSELNHSSAVGHMYPTSSHSPCLQMSPASNPDSSLGSVGYGGEMSDSNHSDAFMEDDTSRASTPNSAPYTHPAVPQQTGSVIGSRTTTTTPAKKYGGNVGHTKHTIHLWQFLRELLLQPNHFNNCIRWVDQRKGIFKIEDSARVARLWGQRKNRPAMNYDKLSRSIRQYYKKGIIKKTEQSKRLVYQFCEAYL